MVDPPHGELNRRTFLQIGGTGAAGVVATQVLAGCGGGSSPSNAETNAEEAKPRRGGTLRVGMMGSGQAESLNPKDQSGYSDAIRATQIYETLFSVDSEGIAKPWLAESAETRDDGTTWVIKLRKGVKFHDGKELTSDDALYSMRTWLAPEFYAGALAQSLMEKSGLRKLDKYSVEVKLKRPVGEFAALLATYQWAILPTGGQDFSNFRNPPPGTGPFTVKSFSPGSRSVFLAFKDYWDQPRPYVDELIIDSTFTDESTRVNALLSGAIDVVPVMQTSMAKANAKNPAVRISSSAGTQMQYFACRVDTEPFKDPRVMQALRLVLDQPRMIETVFSGYAQESNQLPVPNIQYWNSDVPVPERDVEKAKALLAAAGKASLSLKLDTSSAVNGFVEAATVYAEQARDAGIDIKVNKIPAAVYYTTSGGGRYGSYPMFASTAGGGSTLPCITAYYLKNQWMGAAYKETHFGSKADDALLFEAVGTVDPDAAREKWNEVQAAQLDHGGLVIYGNGRYVDGYAKNVQGLNASKGGWCDNWRLMNTWLA